MVASPRQWALALLAAIGAHVLAGALLWLAQTGAESPERAPRGVMVSLDALNAGLQPEQPATPAPVKPAAVPRAATPAPIPAPQPVAPEPASTPPAPALPVGPEPATPAELADRGIVLSDSGVAIPVANTVTIRSADTVEAIPPASQVIAQTPDAAVPSSANGANGHSENATVTYIDRLRAWLGRHKYYPQQARRARAEGTVRLYIAVNREGQVLSASISQSSGNTALDRAAIDMVRRAEPLPAMSEGMLRTRLELIVPVRFMLE